MPAPGISDVVPPATQIDPFHATELEGPLNTCEFRSKILYPTIHLTPSADDSIVPPEHAATHTIPFQANDFTEPLMGAVTSVHTVPLNEVQIRPFAVPGTVPAPASQTDPFQAIERTGPTIWEYGVHWIPSNETSVVIYVSSYSVGSPPSIHCVPLQATLYTVVRTELAFDRLQ